MSDRRVGARSTRSDDRMRLRWSSSPVTEAVDLAGAYLRSGSLRITLARQCPEQAAARIQDSLAVNLLGAVPSARQSVNAEWLMKHADKSRFVTLKAGAAINMPVAGLPRRRPGHGQLGPSPGRNLN